MDYNKLKKEMTAWKEEKIISEEQFDILNERYAPKKISKPVDKKKNVRVMSIIALVVFVIGSLFYMKSFMPNSYLGQIMPKINDIVVFCSFAFLAAAFIYLGGLLEHKELKVIRALGKALILIGCIFTSFIIFYIDIKLSNKFNISIFGQDWSTFIIVAGLILLIVSYIIKNNVVLVYSLFSFVVWFISQGRIYEGSYTGNWLGMTFPTRMILFSTIFIILGFLHNNNIKKLKTIDLTQKYKNFSKLYYTFGLWVAFLAAWIASLGGFIIKPMFPIKTEILLFVLISMAISIYLVYTGIIKNDRRWLNLGMAFLILEVYGKLYQFIYAKINSTALYVIVFIIAIGVAVIIEYIIKYQDQIREELLKEQE